MAALTEECSCLQVDSVKPLAAVAAVASHRLLSIATKTVALEHSQHLSNGSSSAGGHVSSAQMVNALAAMKALVAAPVPILDTPVVANLVQLLQQLLDKVKRLLFWVQLPLLYTLLRAS